MPRNGSGTYSLPQPPFVSGTVISSAAVNSDFSDIATALTGSLPRDGQAGMIGQMKAVDGSIIAPSYAFNNDSTSGFFRPSNGQIGIAISGIQVGLFTSSGFVGSVPVGVVNDYAGAIVPSLWLLCYGQAVSRTTYAALFAALGTTYGSGDGSTTFNLPDLRGNTIVGKDNMGGVAAGRLTTAFYGTDPTVLGNLGGSQSKILLTTNLPSYTPTGTVPVVDTGHFHNMGGVASSTSTFQSSNTGGGVNVPNPAGPVNTNSASTGITASFSGVAQGGASTAFATIQPSLVMNKIIFAGA